MNNEIELFLTSLLGGLMAFFAVAKMLRWTNGKPPRTRREAPTQAEVAVEVEEVRTEAQTSASQKVETLTQEVKDNAQDAETAAAALRDSQL
jgi:hypothetical protein